MDVSTEDRTKKPKTKRGETNNKKKNDKLCPKTAKDLFSDFKPSEDSDIDSDTKDTISSFNDSDSDSEPLSKKQKQFNNKKILKKPKKDSTSKRYTQKYKKDWEQIPSLKLWLSQSIHGEAYFYCKLCKRDYRSCKSGISRHMNSMKHQLQLKCSDSNAKKTFTFKGLLCPVVTPFENSKPQEINFKLIQSYGEFLKHNNVKGLLINDILGEGMSLTVEERKKVTQQWAEICKKNNQFLMVQVGGAPLKNVIEMVRHAESLNVDAIALLPDLYSNPKSHLDIIRYIKCVAKCCKNVPVFYHHYPDLLPTKIDISQFLLDITGEVDLFEGLIYSTSDFQASLSVLRISQEKFTIFIGTDEAILGAVASGFDCITSNCLNILPKIVSEIYQRVKNNKVETARRIQDVLNKALDIVYSNGRTTASIKAAMSVIIADLPIKTTREPLENIWEGNIDKMKKDLYSIGIK